jgi:mycothione reductase
VLTAVHDYGSAAYGWAMEDTTGIAKVVADRRTGEILGAHIMGYQSSSIVQPLIQAMTFGQTAMEVARGQYWIHPALPEVIEQTLLKLYE